MEHSFFYYLSAVDSLFWGYFAFMLISVLGVWLSVQARFFQIRALPLIVKTFFRLLSRQSDNSRGVHPLRAFFASVGGMIGIGNIVGIVTAVQMGGPGALFWVWMAMLIGSIIKYSEIFLGLTFRTKNDRGGYDGGPIYFLARAFKSRWVPIMVAILLCIYGVEIYQFTVVADSLATNFEWNRFVVIGGLLLLVLYSSLGGVKRLGAICGWVMPGFIAVYLMMALWVIFQELPLLPEVLKTVFVSAFTGHAAVGGFAGSSVLLAIQHGISRAAYSADIGIGYDSIIQSESNTVYPHRQARLAILGICLDNLVCTMSILIVLLSGVWKSADPIGGSLLVQTALSQYFPYMHLFMPIFIAIVGYTTLIAYFCVGLKCAHFLHPRHGIRWYVIYGTGALIAFSFLDQTHALLVMSIAGSLLLITNLLGIFILRHHVEFASEKSDETEMQGQSTALQIS